jgi:hypothetical protein
MQESSMVPTATAPVRRNVVWNFRNLIPSKYFPLIKQAIQPHSIKISEKWLISPLFWKKEQYFAILRETGTTGNLNFEAGS